MSILILLQTGGAPAITGTGALDAASAAADSTGEQLFVGAGGLVAIAAVVDGVGEITEPGIAGVGALDAAPATVDAVGEYTPLAITGEGALVAAAGLVSGGDVAEAPPSRDYGGMVVTRRQKRRSRARIRPVDLAALADTMVDGQGLMAPTPPLSAPSSETISPSEIVAAVTPLAPEALNAILAEPSPVTEDDEMGLILAIVTALVEAEVV